LAVPCVHAQEWAREIHDEGNWLMAIAAGDEVAIKRVVSDAALASRGNVLFGVVALEDGGGNADVIWENGEFAQLIPTTVLDKILGVNAPQEIVEFTGGSNGVESPSYRGTIVRRYTRSLEGSSTPTSFTLIRLLSNPLELVEALSSAVQPVPGA
jgi:hypothetical protein